MKTLLALKVNTSWFLVSSILLMLLTNALSSRAQYSARQVQGQADNADQTKFWIYTPFTPGNPAPGTEYPLLISLHGGSALGDNLNMLLEPAHENPALLIANNRWFNLPYIVVSPQLKLDPEFALDYNEQNWPPELVDEVIEYVKTLYNINDNRIYVTGISLGAAGTWNYAVAYPEKVAAILPVGGKAPKGDACALKDVPVWVFHGENDFLVVSRFATDMVEAIKSCTPTGRYIPHANIAYSMEHPVWNEVYNMTGGYDVYSWLYSFERGDFSNKAPFVFTGLDRRMLLPPSESFYLTAEYFDSDGTITNVQWSQVANGSEMLTLDDTDPKFLKVSGADAAGTYVFRLTVTDNDGGVRSDDVSITLLTANDSRAVLSLRLTGQTGSPDLGLLADNQVFDLNVIGNKINIEANFQGSGSRIRWGINTDQNTRNLTTIPNFLKATNAGLQNSGWTVTKKGDYLVCATAFSNAGGTLGTEGTSLCYKITFTDELGVRKYYAQAGSDISNLNSWEDESGNSPANFSDANQWFIIPATAVLSAGALNISGTNSKLVVSTTGNLTISNTLTGPFHIEGNANVKVTVSGAVTVISSVSRTSTFVFESSATMIVPNLEFGHLILRGTGNKNFTSGNTLVRGNLTAEAGSAIINTNNAGVPSLNGNVNIVVSGSVNLLSNTSFPFALRFVEGFGNQHLTLPGSYTFRNLFVEKGLTVNVVAPEGSTISLGVVSGGGALEVHNFALLKLNGKHLRLTGNGVINPPNGALPRIGKVELDNSTLTIDAFTTTGTAFNLYPAPGKNNLKSLEVNIPSGHATGFSIMAPLNITDALKVTNGTINTNGFVTLRSTENSTAYVAPVGGVINGDVNVERWVKKGKTYRYLSFPVQGFSVEDLQEVVPVTGDFEGSSTGSTSPSLFNYNEPSVTVGWGWEPFPIANNSETFERGKGYAVYVRDASNPKTITFNGSLHTGTIPFDLTPNPNPAVDSLGWNLLGNPYAAPILWDAMDGDSEWNRSSTIDEATYIRDNNESGDGFKIWDGEIGDLPGGIISSGQAFWVRVNDDDVTPVISVTEDAKVQSTTPLLYRTKRSEVVFLKIKMKRNSTEDNAFIKFKRYGKPEWIKGRDAVKKKNDYFNLSILSTDDHSLAIKSLSDTICSQELGLLVQPKVKGTYSLSVEGNAFDNVINKLYIVDQFTGTTSEFEEGDDYVFQVTNDSKSSAKQRFKLIIEKTNVVQPVITMEDGVLISTIDESIQWLRNGIVIDGATAGVYVPMEDGDYTVRTIGKNCTKTSEIYSFRITSIPEVSKSEIKLYPNPTTGSITLSGLKSSAAYKYTVVSLSGASLLDGDLNVSSFGEAEIKLRAISPGFYLLKVMDANHTYQFKFAVK